MAEGTGGAEALNPYSSALSEAYSSSAMSMGGGSTLYRAPKLALTKMPKEARTPMKNVDVCMCCNEIEFGLFRGK